MAKIKTRRYYIYYLARMAFFLISLLPLKVALVIADTAGKIAFRVLGKYRRIATDNLEAALGIDGPRVEKIAEGVFRNLAKNGAEWFKMASPFFSGPRGMVSEMVGKEYLDKAVSEGRGVVFTASHFGNWELIPLYLRYMGYEGAVLGRRLYFHKYNTFINRLRTRSGVKVFYRDGSARDILRFMKRGGLLGVLADQDVDSVEGVFVDFLGEPAYTPVGPVKLAAAAGAYLMPIFMIRKKDNTHKLVIKEPFEVIRDAAGEVDLAENTRRWTSVLEKHVREYPEQWVWVHSRWKTKKDR